MQDFNKYFLGSEEQLAVMYVYVYVRDVQLHLQIESCFCAKPCFMRLGFPLLAKKFLSISLGQVGQDICHCLHLLWIHPRHNIYLWQQMP